jgi:mono/diheme cytochrome c family protein
MKRTRGLSGENSFNFYCATCHGRDGRGAGPVATALNTRPADLTALARRNRGLFPRAEVISFVMGTDLFARSSGPIPV